MQPQIAGLVAVVGMLALPPGSGTPERPASAAPPSAWVLQGPPARARTEPLNATSRVRRASTADERAFPVRGRHDLGTAVNGFGGGRGHDGQDIFADCGTPVDAARAGRVVEVATGGAEGNYVVLKTSDGRQHAYLHLLHPHSVAKGRSRRRGRPHRQRRPDRQRAGLPPALRAVDVPGPVHGRPRHEPAAGAQPLGERGLKRRSRSALATTLTLESAIAAPAITGLRKPAAASGMAATL